MLLMVQVLLYLPIIAYAVIMCITGIYLHTYLTCVVLVSYLFTICLLSARWYLYNIKNRGLAYETMTGKINLNLRESSYWKLFIRYIARNKKLLFIGMKIFNCGILSGMLMNQSGSEYELKMIILFFSLGILGHGLLIHQIRDLEETRLSFYRTIPVSLFNRFVQYAAFYLIILLPEIFTILLYTPKYLHYTDAVLLIFFSYSLLLFMHSLLFIQLFRMKVYLKLILCLYLIIYFSILISSFLWLCVFLFLSPLRFSGTGITNTNSLQLVN